MVGITIILLYLVQIQYKEHAGGLGFDSPWVHKNFLKDLIMIKQDDFKLLLNFVLVNIVSAENNKTADEITMNLRSLDKWQEDLTYRLTEDYLNEKDFWFYNKIMETIRKTLTNELEEMNKVL